MDSPSFVETLLKFSSLGGTINPYLGMAIFVAGLGFMIWWGWKKKQIEFEERKKTDSKSSSEDASKGQDSVQSGIDKTEDFLNKP